MAKIPHALHEHINTAFPANPILIATSLPNGYAQVTPRGSVLVFDDNHFMMWERGKGTTTAELHDGSKVTVFFRKGELRTSLLPKGAIARFYGTAKIYKSGPIYDQVWDKVIQPEKDRDPDKGGFAVLIEVERAEDLSGDALV